MDVDLDLEMPYPLNEISLIEFEFDTPYPKKPNMADYLARGGGDGVLSEKIYQALSPLNVKGIQLIPATIANPKNKDI
ncbi:hypothetical protein FACS189429_2200 [Bacteroidia bacterium]|nr:hypothetical protein FACS189429_2200 [Bacteroidia bacterium]